MDLTYDSQTNSLRLSPTSSVAAVISRMTKIDGILDIGEAGRLIGVEFPADASSLANWRSDPSTDPYVTHDAGRAYIQITAGDTGTSRSTEIELTAEYDSDNRLLALAIPRRGHGYEISYPSGNQ